MEEQNKQTELAGQEENGKVAKGFDNTMKKLVAIVGGKENLFPVKKVKKDVISTLVGGLLKERKENLEKDIKTELITLLDKHVELTKSIEAKRKELKQLEEQKMKEFNEAASKLFNKIDDIDNIEKDYYNAINATGK